MLNTSTINPNENNNIDLESVAEEISLWRQSKTYQAAPIPDDIKQKIYNVHHYGTYPIFDITKKLKISRDQLYSIMYEFRPQNDDNLNSPPEPEFLPFKVIPCTDDKQYNTADPNSTNDSTTLNTLTKNNISNITINRGSGDNIQLPTTLNEAILMQIIKLFLCSK